MRTSFSRRRRAEALCLMGILCVTATGLIVSGCGDKEASSSSSGAAQTHWSPQQAAMNKLTPDQAHKAGLGVGHDAPPGSAMPPGGPHIPGVNAPK